MSGRAPESMSPWGIKLWTAHAGTILASLRITAIDLAAILNHLFPPSGDSQITLANLAAIYRYATLAKALNLSVNDLISLKQLIGISPFPNWSDSQIVVKLPEGATTGNVVVTVAGS